MKVVTTITNGEQNIQGLMPNGNLVPMNLTMEDGKAVVEILGPAIDLKSQSEEVNCRHRHMTYSYWSMIVFVR